MHSARNWRGASPGPLASRPRRVFYLALIIPHLVLMGALLAFAYYSHRVVVDDAGESGPRWSDGDQGEPPREPLPGPSGGFLPLAHSAPPRRRLHAGERLSDLHPARPRRGREGDPYEPRRTPVQDPQAR
jgi:hypothetical protein